MVLLALIAIALIGAGIWWFNETLIQLSLYRFSIFIKLFTCVAAAIWIERKLARQRVIAIASAGIGIAVIILGILRGPYFGFYRVPQDDAKYLAACDWIRVNTPSDAIFLVPPSEQSFRLRAQRAIIVNFKGVPQLRVELTQWRDRMSDVLALRDLRALPRGFNFALQAINERYESLPPEALFTAARKYGARYVLVGHPLASAEGFRVSMTSDAYFLYDLQTN